MSENQYFSSYSSPSIHEEMLRDKARTNFYRACITSNPQIFKDAVVLDLGCGTCILSIFAAKAGAKEVYAIEASVGAANMARMIVKDNGLEDTITILLSTIEALPEPYGSSSSSDDSFSSSSSSIYWKSNTSSTNHPSHIKSPVQFLSVDIIISEFMGYSLLFESMIDSFIFARRWYLKPGGLLLPDKAVMYVMGVEDRNFWKEKVEFWDDVYDIDMASMKPLTLGEAIIEYVGASDSFDSRFRTGDDTDRSKKQRSGVVTNACPILQLDLLTCEVEDYKTFRSEFTLKITGYHTPHPSNNLESETIEVNALLIYFDVAFTGNVEEPMGFSTSPLEDYTHWKNVLLYFNFLSIEKKHAELREQEEREGNAPGLSAIGLNGRGPTFYLNSTDAETDNTPIIETNSTWGKNLKLDGFISFKGAHLDNGDNVNGNGGDDDNVRRGLEINFGIYEKVDEVEKKVLGDDCGEGWDYNLK